MFPDSDHVARASEAAWLDSLLQSLAEDEDDEEEYALDAGVSTCSEEDLLLLSPLGSPMASSDDLPSQNSTSLFQQHPYPVVYPPYQSPASPPWDDFLEDDALPYQSIDDIEQIDACPEAIEDTSDDESEAPATPSLGHSKHQDMVAFQPSLSPVGEYPVDPASVPLPPDRSGLRHVVPSKPHVFYNAELGFGLRHFDFDSLPLHMRSLLPSAL
jgi:hypothetical protein